MRVRLPRVERPERRLFVLELDEAEAAAHAVRILHHQRLHHVPVAGEVGPQAVLSDPRPRQAADEELPGLVLRLLHITAARSLLRPVPARRRWAVWEGGGGRGARFRSETAARVGERGGRLLLLRCARVGWVWAREV